MPNEIRGFGYIDKSKDGKLIGENSAQNAHNVKLDEGTLAYQTFAPSANTYGQSCTYLKTVYTISGTSISNGTVTIGVEDPSNADIELALTATSNTSFNNKNVDNLNFVANTAETNYINFTPVVEIKAPNAVITTNTYWAGVAESSLPTNAMASFKLYYLPMYYVSYIVNDTSVGSATLTITGTVATGTTTITCSCTDSTYLSATTQILRVNDEYMTTSAVSFASPVAVLTIASRGYYDTVATNHDVGDTIKTKHGVKVGHDIQIITNYAVANSPDYLYPSSPLFYGSYDVKESYYVVDGNKPTATSDWEIWYKSRGITIKGLPDANYWKAHISGSYALSGASSSWYSASNLQAFDFPTTTSFTTFKSMSNVTNASISLTNRSTESPGLSAYYYAYMIPQFGDWTTAGTYVTASSSLEDIRVRKIEHYLRPSWMLTAYHNVTGTANAYHMLPVYSDIYVSATTVTNATTPTSLTLTFSETMTSSTNIGFINHELFSTYQSRYFGRTWAKEPSLAITLTQNQLGTYRYGITLAKEISGVTEESALSVVKEVTTVTGNEGNLIQYSFPFLEYDSATGTYLSAYDADEIYVYHQQPNDTDFFKIETIDISDYSGLTYAQLVALGDTNLIINANVNVQWTNYDTFDSTGDVLITQNNYPPPVSPNYIISWSNRLWVAADNVIWYSIDGNPNFFGADSFFTLDGSITGLAVVNEQLVIGTSKGLGRISGYDDDTFQLKMIAPEITIASNSLISFKTRGYFIVSGEGIYVTDAIQAEKMGYAIGRSAETSLTSIHNVRIDNERFINWETTTGSPYYQLTYDTLMNGFSSTTYISSAYLSTVASVQTYWKSKEFTFDMPDMRKNIPQMEFEYIGEVAIGIYKDGVLTTTKTLTTTATRTYQRFWIDDTKFYSMSFMATLLSTNSKIYSWQPLRFKK